jgi:retinol-binding protein 3
MQEEFTMKKPFFIPLILIVSGFVASAQERPKTLGASEKKAVAEAAASILQKKYVFPEAARKMSDLIKKNLKAGKYQFVEDPRTFAVDLTKDLRSISHDQHLAVYYGPERIAEMKTPDEAKKKAAQEHQKKLDRMDNYGFKETRILDGNIGYLKFNFFSADQEAFRVAVGAMAFLANCDALIVDLRENGGGNPEMIQLLSSYFFSGEPRHLNSFYYRMDEKTEQYWTLPYVPGSKLAETDLYVLTSNDTFSGAEEFTYNLKNMKRATVIGETTGGGAHPVKMEILNDDFIISVPYARAVNPISKTNWEGTGIEPDVKVPAGQALNRAQAMALEKLAAKEKDERIKPTYQWALDGLLAKMNPVTIADGTLESYAGNYGPRRISFENGNLFYQRENGPKLKMIPMSEDYFRFENVPYFRLKIVKKDGRVTGIEGHYDNGTTDANPRSE